MFERGASIGFASLSQMTVGVQVGGQTFSELILFPEKEALDKFRQGEVAFTANASAVIVKAAASGTTNFDGVTAHAYSRGGMLLELSLGGQKLTFIPPEQGERAEAPAQAAPQTTVAPEAQQRGTLAPGSAVQALAHRFVSDDAARVKGLALVAGGVQLLRQNPKAVTMLGVGITGLGLGATALAARR